MKPITFSCQATLDLTPQQIAEQILDLKRWPDFAGYFILPGIQSAEFEVRTPEIIGSRIRVRNADGSSHVEEIVHWQPDHCLALRMHEFTPPLGRLATHFEESWSFQRLDENTRVTRKFTLHPKSRLARPALWLISLLLKRAIARHMRLMRRRHFRPGTAAGLFVVAFAFALAFTRWSNS